MEVLVVRTHVVHRGAVRRHTDDALEILNNCVRAKGRGQRDTDKKKKGSLYAAYIYGEISCAPHILL